MLFRSRRTPDSARADADCNTQPVAPHGAEAVWSGTAATYAGAVSRWHRKAWVAFHAFMPASLAVVCAVMATARAQDAPPLPARLGDTGLFVQGTTQIDPRHLPFSPQYPLWSDGAIKRRWLHVPPGTSIDASNPDAWVFPPGTRLWKEFGHGRPVETRYSERLADGTWRFAAYVWNADGTDAVLAPPGGIPAHPAKGAPGGKYAVPSRDDCRTCHEGGASPVLGVSALQLSPDRDPLAPHAESKSAAHVDLPGLVARGILRDLPASLLERPPRVTVNSAVARAALGYLHGNCGHCHNDVGALAALELSLAQETALADSAAKVLHSTLGYTSSYRPRAAQPATHRIVPGRPDASVLLLRMRSRNPMSQMPPLGTQVADDEGLALIERWIHHEQPLPPKEVTP